MSSHQHRRPHRGHQHHAAPHEPSLFDRATGALESAGSSLASMGRATMGAILGPGGPTGQPSGPAHNPGQPTETIDFTDEGVQLAVNETGRSDVAPGQNRLAPEVAQAVHNAQAHLAAINRPQNAAERNSAPAPDTLAQVIERNHEEAYEASRNTLLGGAAAAVGPRAGLAVGTGLAANDLRHGNRRGAAQGMAETTSHALEHGLEHLSPTSIATSPIRDAIPQYQPPLATWGSRAGPGFTVPGTTPDPSAPVVTPRADGGPNGPPAGAPPLLTGALVQGMAFFNQIRDWEERIDAAHVDTEAIQARDARIRGGATVRSAGYAAAEVGQISGGQIQGIDWELAARDGDYYDGVRAGLAARSQGSLDGGYTDRINLGRHIRGERDAAD